MTRLTDFMSVRVCACVCTQYTHIIVYTQQTQAILIRAYLAPKVLSGVYITNVLYYKFV